jgi:hypothetical protein
MDGGPLLPDVEVLPDGEDVIAQPVNIPWCGSRTYIFVIFVVGQRHAADVCVV